MTWEDVLLVRANRDGGGAKLLAAALEEAPDFPEVHTGMHTLQHRKFSCLHIPAFSCVNIRPIWVPGPAVLNMLNPMTDTLRLGRAGDNVSE